LTATRIASCQIVVQSVPAATNTYHHMLAKYLQHTEINNATNPRNNQN